MSDPILEETLRCLAEHRHPELGDRTPRDAFNRLLAKHRGVRPTEWTDFTHLNIERDQIRASRITRTTNELAPLAQHPGAHPCGHSCPVIVAIYEQQERIIDHSPELSSRCTAPRRILRAHRTLPHATNISSSGGLARWSVRSRIRARRKARTQALTGSSSFRTIGGRQKKVIVSVKGGENIGVTMVKDLIATVQRQGAEIGIFVTLTEPTRPMDTEAVAAGFYISPAGGKFRKIQIVTIADLLSGKSRVAYPSLDAGALTFKKAAVEQGEDKQDDLFKSGAATKAKKHR